MKENYEALKLLKEVLKELENSKRKERKIEKLNKQASEYKIKEDLDFEKCRLAIKHRKEELEKIKNRRKELNRIIFTIKCVSLSKANMLSREAKVYGFLNNNAYLDAILETSRYNFELLNSMFNGYLNKSFVEYELSAKEANQIVKKTYKRNFI